MTTQLARVLRQGEAVLGIELGSTRIKACLIDPQDAGVLATGVSEWENSLVNDLWSYSLEEVWAGLQEAFADLQRSVEEVSGEQIRDLGAFGISAMMHGYLAFDASGELLVPFRTWRNTNTGPATDVLTDLFGVNIPHRWSIAHLHQAVVDEEEHVSRVQFFTTLAGYVHWRLTGRKVLGVGDASGMFPISEGTYNSEMVRSYDELAAGSLAAPLEELLPQVLSAGQEAGSLTAKGALLLDPTGTLRPGAPACPPEGDAGTGMVATNAITPRTGNVSVGTSIFAMVVLEKALTELHREIDLVTTPVGDAVAMVHCNNGASELSEWMGVLSEAARVLGADLTADEAYSTLFSQALTAQADAGGLLAYNHLSGEPIAGTSEGFPLVLRSAESNFTLGNFMRAQLYGVYATLALGMKILESEGVGIDLMQAHGGVFRTPKIAQRYLAAALDAPVAVADGASEGGAWGIAVLANFLRHADSMGLSEYLSGHVFANQQSLTEHPDPADVAGFADYLRAYENGLELQRSAAGAFHTPTRRQDQR